MSLWKIAWRSIEQRGLASLLTGISMALGVMLVVAVLVVHGAVNESFMNDSGLGYNLVVGAKGGKLELVLNTVYYIAPPVENLPYSYYQEFTEGRYKSYVAKAVPVCLGDVYQDFRVIGTTTEFFDNLDYGGKKYEFAAGQNFAPSDFFGAVIGATVAHQTGLHVGDEFHPAHGEGSDAHVHDAFKIRGVLKPTGTPNDRGLFINMEGFYLIPEHAKPDDEPVVKRPATHDHENEHAHDDHAQESEHAHEEYAHDEHDHDHDAAHEHHDAVSDDEDHDHEHAQDHGDAHDEHDHDHEHHHDQEHEHEHEHAPLPIEKREVTSILLLTAGSLPELTAPMLIKSINKDNVAQAVLPIKEISKLFSNFVDPLRILLLSLTVLIVVVAGVGILVSIYNSMNERRHEIAVIRALGAGRTTVMSIVLLESILLSLAGGLAGWLFGHVLIQALSPWMAMQTGVSLGFSNFVPQELVIIPGLIILAALVGYLPALAAYRTDVAKSLSATP